MRQSRRTVTSDGFCSVPLPLSESGLHSPPRPALSAARLCQLGSPRTCPPPSPPASSPAGLTRRSFPTKSTAVPWPKPHMFVSASRGLDWCFGGQCKTSKRLVTSSLRTAEKQTPSCGPFGFSPANTIESKREKVGPMETK